MKESHIQTKIRSELTKAGWVVNKIIACSLNGTPDLLCIRHARVVFIEVKRPGNEPDPLQWHRIAELHRHGMEVIVATSIKDVSHLLPLQT